MSDDHKDKVRGQELDDPESLIEFKNTLIKYCGDICGEDGRMFSHPSKATIRLRSVNSEHDIELIAIDIDRRIGCGCCEGVVLEVVVKGDKGGSI